MELFPDGAHVRLRSRMYGMYLHADEDGLGVFLSPRRASLNQAWRVHWILRDSVIRVLLHNAAYGRYLAATDERGPVSHPGQRVVQGVYDHPDAIAVMWNVVDSGYGDVFLRHISGRLLRASPAIVVDYPGNRSIVMSWVVEALQLRPAPRVLPAPTPRVDLGRFRRRTVPTPERTIRYVRANCFGDFHDLCWATFQFQGRSVYVLRTVVARHLGEQLFSFNITLCTQAGRYGRLTPLITDLPRNNEPMDIVALITGSPAMRELQYPDVDAP